MKNFGFRHMVVLAMIGLMLLSGLPSFVPEDANHDREIDIKDAVIMLQLADHQTTGQSIDSCEIILQAIAGLKEIAPPAFETEKGLSSNFCFLIPSVDIDPVFPGYDIISEHSVSFSSILASPPYQPPICL